MAGLRLDELNVYGAQTLWRVFLFVRDHLAFTKRVVHGADDRLAVEEQILLIGHWLTVLVDLTDKAKATVGQLLDNTLFHSGKKKRMNV